MTTICFHDYNLQRTSCQQSTVHRIGGYSTLCLYNYNWLLTVVCQPLTKFGPRSTADRSLSTLCLYNYNLLSSVDCVPLTNYNWLSSVDCQPLTSSNFQSQINKSGICGYSSESLLHLTQDCTKWATLGYLKIRINNLEPLNGLRKPTASFG